ncbi:hypothetical protein PGB90_002762 [Kerria lacca]
MMIPLVENFLLKSNSRRKKTSHVSYFDANPLPNSEKKYVEPVKLTPAWEEKNLPNDVLNFKSVTMEQAELETNPPKDRFLLVYFIILIHGIGILMPWNMFINAKSYFEDYKLSQNYTNMDTSFYVDNFMTFLGIFSQFPNVLFAWLNIFVKFKIFSVANGIYQNTMYGIAAKLPAAYTGAIILGNNVSGIFTTVISILSKILYPFPRTAAVYYFLVALLVLFICFDTYFVLPLTKFYKYHDLQFQKAQQKELAIAEEVNIVHQIPYWKIFKSCSKQCFNVFYTFFITLALFPALQSNIRQSDPNFFIGKGFYVDVMCFLTFNVFAAAGNLLADVVEFPRPEKLHIVVLLRTIFVPLFLFCNYQTQSGRILPIYFNNDYVYWITGILFALTSGHASSLALRYCSKTVANEHSVIAGMFGAACLVSGVSVGLITAFIFPIIVNNISCEEKKSVVEEAMIDKKRKRDQFSCVLRELDSLTFGLRMDEDTYVYLLSLVTL